MTYYAIIDISQLTVSKLAASIQTDANDLVYNLAGDKVVLKFYMVDGVRPDTFAGDTVYTSSEIKTELAKAGWRGSTP